MGVPLSENNQDSEVLRTFLHAQTIRSNPLLPWTMDGCLRFISTTINFSNSFHEARQDQSLCHTVSGFQVLPSTVLSQLSNKACSLIDFFEKIKPQDTYLVSAYITEKTSELSFEEQIPVHILPSYRENTESVPGRPSESIMIFPSKIQKKHHADDNSAVKATAFTVRL